MLPLRWWPHSQVPQLWPGNIQRQAGLSLGVCEDIHVQEGSSKGVFGAKVISLKVAISSVPVSSTQALVLTSVQGCPGWSPAPPQPPHLSRFQ